ncbi:MAG: EscU/YscU/HrcU family type III secretion system export apparatus switch protein [Nitrospinae bacterium]|nr:EscU/YscU/HrcU family type III secretion system export apparatus switch protein [Nitrospinota bacterium]
MNKDNPPTPKLAVSLQYKRGMNAAPKVTAKGQGWVAEKIIKMAQENNIPIREDKDLLNLLSEIDVGKEVPESLYKVVAELLAWVYQLNKNFPDKQNAKWNKK